MTQREKLLSLLPPQVLEKELKLPVLAELAFDQALPLSGVSASHLDGFALGLRLLLLIAACDSAPEAT